ncbi:hypothetical protein FRC07_005992, partial [Ceratobasidium sp. 392]
MESPPNAQQSETFSTSPDLDSLLSQSAEAMFGQIGNEDDEDEDELERRSDCSEVDEDIPDPQVPPEVPSSIPVFHSNPSPPPASAARPSTPVPLAAQPAAAKKRRNPPNPKRGRAAQDRE